MHAASILNSVSAVKSLKRDEARQQLSVDFEATVLYSRLYQYTLFVEQDGVPIYVSAHTSLNLVPGDRVRIQGTTRPSFRTYVVSSQIDLLGHGPVPVPEKVTYEQLRSGDTDCQLITVKAHILSADFLSSGPNGQVTTSLEILIDGEKAEATLDSSDPALLKELLDADVEITGVSGEQFDNKMQQTGILLHVQNRDWMKILSRNQADPWSLPITPMNLLYGGYAMRDLSQRMRVHGTITYYEPGSAIVLEDGAKSVWVTTATAEPMRIGDMADAIGFPDVRDGFLYLTRSEIRDSGVQAPVVPALLTWRDLAMGGNESGGHSFDLVSIEGRVATAVRQGVQDEYVLEADGHVFSAIMRHPAPGRGAPLPTMREVAIGSRLRVTGICMLQSANPFNGGVPFNILLRSYDDIETVAQPPWFDVRHLTMIVIALVLVIFLFGIRVVWTERQARRYNAHQAYLERRRGKILEDINNARPLAEILERITGLVSARLNGTPCWCKVADGATLGSCPSEEFLARLRVVTHEITGRSGGVLGNMYAAFAARSKPDNEEGEALKQATGLATLAIETSRLYSDLVHRSEFDLLTDIHNRFSLEKHLEGVIDEARQSAGIFGLLYVDLNDFKLVNDQFGHRTGDLYLQEVALRMKRQLRPGDVLARLGGDEFAVVVLRIHSRTDVEVISHRLERCFEQPFACDGQSISGSASIGIAMYPDDSATRDGLLSAADAAMYVAKQSKPRRGERYSGQAVSEQRKI
ncbi:MAG TPA: GGDEF domain-containing protein [Terracidiphilus sp.]|nr:GGDEF domain-containing protein [Terracidiphilus sp.]